MSGIVQFILILILAILGGGAFIGYHVSQRAPSWERLDAIIDEQFPNLPSIDARSLDQWLSDTSRQPPLILDARSAEEFAISHLPTARRVGTGPDAAPSLSAEDRARQVVVYAAADPRAAPVVRDLVALGVDAFHLTHGIFGWANADLPVVDEQGPTTGVHRMDATNQRLLREDLRRRPDRR